MAEQPQTFWERNKKRIIALLIVLGLSIYLLLSSGGSTTSEECHKRTCHIDDNGERVCTTEIIPC